MQITRKIKGYNAAKRKLKRILFNQKYRCINCDTKMLTVKCVRENRECVGPIGDTIKWRTNLGEIITSPVATVDHIIPRWNNGTNSTDNLQGMCSRCNNLKHQEETKHFIKHKKGRCRKCGEYCDHNAAICNTCKRGNMFLLKVKNTYQREYLHKIELNGEIWSWKYSESAVQIKYPNELFDIRVSKDVLLGISWKKIKKNKDVNSLITSEVVKKFVERIIVNKEAPKYDLYVMRGIQGSGKSTRAKELLEEYGKRFSIEGLTPEGHIFSADEFFYKILKPEQPDVYNFNPRFLEAAHKWNYLRIQDAMIAKKTPIILDNCNKALWEPRDVCILALAHDYNVSFHYSQTDWWKEFEESPKKEYKRLAQVFSEKTIHSVPAWAIKNVMHSFVPREQFTLESVLNAERTK